MKHRSRSAVIEITLALTLFGISINAQTKPFALQQKLQGVSFNVKSPNTAANNKVTITTRGLTRNAVITRSVNGIVTGAELGDLNIDRSPEIYIYILDGKTSHLLAFSLNNRKSLTEIYLPELDPNSKEAQGYRGRDEFTLIENTFARRFPVYKPDDSEVQATGGMRQLEYKLIAGENGWILKLERVTEY